MEGEHVLVVEKVFVDVRTNQADQLAIDYEWVALFLGQFWRAIVRIRGRSGGIKRVLTVDVERVELLGESQEFSQLTTVYCCHFRDFMMILIFHGDYARSVSLALARIRH